MDPVTLGAIISAGAMIAAALIGKNWGERRGRDKEREFWEKTLKSAPDLYTTRIGILISEASASNSNDIMAKARSIVSTRNDLRGSLVSLAALLNSDIDRLSIEIAEAEQAANRDTGRIRETVAVLKSKWPGKREQVEVELRKILAELGLERKS